MVTNGGGGGAIGGGTWGGGGAMGGEMMPESFRAGQPTNAAVTRRAFAMTMILRTSDRFFMAGPPMTKRGRRIAAARGSVNTTTGRRLWDMECGGLEFDQASCREGRRQHIAR